MDKDTQALAGLVQDLSAQVLFLETTVTNLLARLKDMHSHSTEHRARFRELLTDLAAVWPDVNTLAANDKRAIWLAKGVGIDEIPGDE